MLRNPSNILNLCSLENRREEGGDPTLAAASTSGKVASGRLYLKLKRTDSLNKIQSCETTPMYFRRDTCGDYDIHRPKKLGTFWFPAHSNLDYNPWTQGCQHHDHFIKKSQDTCHNLLSCGMDAWQELQGAIITWVTAAIFWLSMVTTPLVGS